MLQVDSMTWYEYQQSLNFLKRISLSTKKEKRNQTLDKKNGFYSFDKIEEEIQYATESY